MALFAASLLCFYGSSPVAALLLRCGLTACFSPRTALALSSIAALCASLMLLLRRGILRAALSPPCQALAPFAFMGGTLGRALLLMLCSRLSGSHALLRAQALPLLALCLPVLLLERHAPLRRPDTGMPFAGVFLCAMADGFFGAGSMALLPAVLPAAIQRRPGHSVTPVLVCEACAQLGAILLALASGAAQRLPLRMLLSTGLGAALGALCAECKKRDAAHEGLRIALDLILICSALSGVEQAFLF